MNNENNNYIRTNQTPTRAAEVNYDRWKNVKQIWKAKSPEQAIAAFKQCLQEDPCFHNIPVKVVYDTDSVDLFPTTEFKLDFNRKMVQFVPSPLHEEVTRKVHAFLDNPQRELVFCVEDKGLFLSDICRIAILNPQGAFCSQIIRRTELRRFGRLVHGVAAVLVPVLVLAGTVAKVVILEAIVPSGMKSAQVENILRSLVKTVGDAFLTTQNKEDEK